MTTTDPFAGVPAPLASALRRRGFTAPTAVQRAVLEAECEGRDLRISSQTGSGKTVALGIALARPLLAAPHSPAGPAALVIVPTRELAVQVREELRWLYAEVPGLRVEAVTGGTDLSRERRRLAEKPAIVVATPGRLLDHLRAGALDCTGVGHVVLDEADQMFDLGFREELDAILEALPAERRSHLLSATFPPPVRQLADRFQKDALRLEGTRLGAAHEDIVHVAHLVRPHEVYAALVNLLLLAEGARCLVFVRRRADTTELAEQLAGDGFVALPLSGDLAQAQRTRTLAAFRNGSVPILVATDVAARGLDVPDLATVIHLEPPRDAEAYTHRSGRTGRAGRKGLSLLLVPPHARRRVEWVLANARVSADWQPAPTPARVRRTLEKRHRRRLRARLAAAETPLGEARLAHAAELLEGRDPVAVVAALVELAAPALPREPLPLTAVEAHEEEPWRAPRRPRPHAGRRAGGPAGAHPRGPRFRRR
jgi:ATP-dependent RNA helicase DeaD